MTTDVKYSKESLVVPFRFRSEIRCFVNSKYDVSICTVDCEGTESHIEVQPESIRALGEFLVRLADKEGV